MAAVTFAAIPAAAAAQRESFGPLDPNILNASIPAFFIGRNADGLWVARERCGQIGGLFLLRSSALAFARLHAGNAACATIFPADGVELDIKNNGNRLAGLIGPLMRRARNLKRPLNLCAG